MEDAVTHIEILRPGLYSSIQKLPREYSTHLGVPVGGPLDRASAIIANALVGNSIEMPLIEMTMLGPLLHFAGGDCTVVITGADMFAELNGDPVMTYTPLKIVAGSVLKFARTKNGSRTYMAIGMIDDAESLSVSSAFEKRFYHTILKKGSDIRIRPKNPKGPVKAVDQPVFNDNVKIRLVRGPEFTDIDATMVDHFATSTFKVSSDTDRMGCRLKGEMPGTAEFHHIISSGVVPGTVQITPSGMPLIALADGQTTGGYPRIANVISADLDRVGQLRPGDTVSFEFIEREVGVELMREYNRRIRALV